jgi:hypothetical protein
MTRARSVSKLINSNVLTIDDTNTNSVGIGSTTPNEKLDVVGVVSATSSVFAGDGVGIGTTANDYALNVIGGGNVSGVVTAQGFSGDGSLLSNVNVSAAGWTNDSQTPILYNTSLTEVGIGTSVATGSNLTVGDAGVAGTSLLVNNEARFAGIITGTDATFTNVVRVGTAITADATSGIITATGVNATGIVTATSFVGNVTGNVTGDVTGDVTGNADTATSVTVSANNTTNETVYPIFVDGATGTQGAETDTGLTYNPSTGTLTATTFSGNVTGNATGLSGSPNITVTDITATNITASGTLTYEDVTNIDSLGIITARNSIDVTSGGINVSSGIVTATSFAGDGSSLSGLELDITSSMFL